MKKVAILGLVSLCMACFQPAMAEDRQATEQQLKELQAEMKKLDAWLKDVSAEKNSLEGKLQETETTISDNMAQIERLNREIDRLKKQITELAQQQSQLRITLAEQQQQIEKLLVASYKQGRQNQLKMLLNQQNPNDLRRMMNYAHWLTDSQQTLLLSYQEKLVTLKQSEASLKERRESLQTAQTQIASRTKSLQDQQNRRTKLIADLSAQYRDGSRRLDSMKSDRARLQELITRMDKAIQEIVPPSMSRSFAQARGALGWPADGRILHNFGDRIGNGPLRWEGILIQGKEGAPVAAVSRGRVVFANWLKGFGLLVIVDHGDGYMSLYGRNEVLLREVGEWVNKGDLLARTGESGLRENGVYFEIRYKGQPRNPAKWLARSR